MVSWTGVAAVVVLVLAAIGINADRPWRDRQPVEPPGSFASPGAVGVDPSERLARRLRDEEGLQAVFGPSKRHEALLRAARVLLLGVPVGFVAGLFLWLVVGALPPGEPLATVAFAVGFAVPPSALLLTGRRVPLVGRTEYVATDQRLFRYDGRDDTVVDVVDLDSVRAVTVTAGRLETRLGVGAVVVSGDGASLTFERVEAPDAVAAEVASLAAGER